MKEENAITLVALVITILVLLILAGISLTLVLGNDGILGKAQESSNIFANATKQEKDKLTDYETIIRNQNTLINQLKNGIINIGDYVDYDGYSESVFISNKSGDELSNGFANQTFSTDNNRTAVKWRILGTGDESGNLTNNAENATCVLLISDNPIQKNINSSSENNFDKDPYFYMGKAEGYINAKNILDGICNLYLNEEVASSARSINVEDINHALNVCVDYEEKKVYNREDNNLKNIDIIKHIGNTYSFSSYDFSARSYANNKKTALENGDSSEVANGYTYMTNSVNNISNILNDLLFSEEEYWLASTTVDIKRSVKYCIGEVTNNMINLSDSQFSSNGSWNVKGLGVRPVIVLKPEITSDELKVIKSTTNKWCYQSTVCYCGNIDDYDTTGTEINVY